MNVTDISINNIKIFVLHYTALVERKEHIIKQLKKYNYKFIYTSKLIL